MPGKVADTPLKLLTALCLFHCFSLAGCSVQQLFPASILPLHAAQCGLGQLQLAGQLHNLIVLRMGTSSLYLLCLPRIKVHCLKTPSAHPHKTLLLA